MVLDDVADPGHLRGLWPPSSPSGRTLLTTRRRDAALTGPERNLMEVGLFTPAEAAAYLGDALAVHGRHEAPEQLAALALDLGYLPLALSQAAAYLIDADLDCATYRTRLADRNTSLTTLLPDSSGLPDDQAVTVTAAWSLSLEQANRTRPRNLARPMLQLAAMLNANSIPDRSYKPAGPRLPRRPARRHTTVRPPPRTAPDHNSRGSHQHAAYPSPAEPD